jgi:SAM-dependent methyltransferase
MFVQQQVIDDRLSAAWQLEPEERAWFDAREGHLCGSCGMSRRVRMLLWTLRRTAADLAGLSVLHLNDIRNLAPALAGAAAVVETVHDPRRPWGARIDSRTNQDMQRLGFDDARFDVVLHSETIEHLEDYRRALSEALRVLKPGGRQVYTVPLLHARRTRSRQGLPPSFHGLKGEDKVLWEFGGDFLSERRPFLERVDYDDFWTNPTVFAVVERKPD